jgi:hypothetical protein
VSPGSSSRSSSTSQGVKRSSAEEDEEAKRRKLEEGDESEEHGIKRSIDEWENFAKKLKANAEQRAAESDKPGERVEIDYKDVAKEIGARLLGESDAKFDEAVSRLINSTRDGLEEQYCDAIPGELLDGELSKEARKVPMETFRKHGAHEKVPTQEC